MKEGLIKDYYESIIKELQTVITIFYLLTVGIGMLFSYQKYAEFGINIFDYADVFDFLIAPFSDFKILLFSFISISTSYLLLQFDFFVKRKFPAFYTKSNLGLDKKEWFNKARYFFFGSILFLYLFISSDIYADQAAKKTKEQAAIQLKYSDNEVITGILIGKTKDIIFLLQDEKVKAIPITALVKEFEIK